MTTRYIYDIPSGFVIFEDSGIGRILYNDGNAEDINKQSHQSLFKKAIEKGEKTCLDGETIIEKPKRKLKRSKQGFLR